MTGIRQDARSGPGMTRKGPGMTGDLVMTRKGMGMIKGGWG